MARQSPPGIEDETESGVGDGTGDGAGDKVEDFARRVLTLAGPEAAGARFALAVSGGSDSLALLLLAAVAFPGRAHVLTVDHGLRPEAADECRMVLARAAECGLPATALALSMAPGANTQARARQLRYCAMADACRSLSIPFLLTAHHLEDQAETVLMRLARGSGVGGLAGIGARSRHDGLAVLRPLLSWHRADLARLVQRRGWVAAADPSNADPHYARTGARQLLAHTPWLRADRLAAAAAHLAEAEAALSWAAARAFAGRATTGDKGTLTLAPEALPGELQRRLLLLGLQQFGCTPDGPALARLLTRLAQGKGGTLGPCLVRVRDGQWILAPAPPRRSVNA